MADEFARLFVAIYTDADIHGGLAAQIRLRGFDAISAYETGNAELSDPDQLAYAVSQRRAILTCNLLDSISADTLENGYRNLAEFAGRT